MYLYTLIAFVAIFAIECSLCTDLSAYLTRNLSQLWLKNQTSLFTLNPYCLICCMNIGAATVGKKCGKHTMCIYKDDKPGPGCKGFIAIRFTDDEVAVIVDIHNTLRNRVAMGTEDKGDPGPQPAASNMRMVQWDSELALLANRWAEQCVFAHDVCRDVARYPVGQNIAKGNFALNNDLSFIVNWYDTVEMFDKAWVANFRIMELDRYPSPMQYSQLVWAETYQVGCARVAFQRTHGPNVTYREHFICNYGPSGNIPDQRVYRTGEPCSECPDGTGCSVEYQGLCASEALYDVVYKKSDANGKKRHGENGGERVDFSLHAGLVYLAYCLVFLYDNL